MDEKQWYLVYSKPKNEEHATQNLERQGFTIYLPRCVEIKRQSKQWREVIHPLFSRYLFIKLSQDDNWSSIRSTRGVNDLVKFGSQPTPIPAHIVDAIRTQENPSGLIDLTQKPVFQSGDPVAITSGGLKGLHAVFRATSSEQRAFVLVDLLSRKNQILINLNDLEKTE